MKLNWLIILATGCALSYGGVVHAKQDKHQSLPPGLQKKVDRGGSLPPGWQKKLAVGETLDRNVYDSGHVVYQDKKDGLLTIKVEGKLIKLIENTHEIVDILDSI